MCWHLLLLLALAGEALTVSRRSACVTPVVGGLVTVAGPALAFDGQGSSAYAGRTPSSVAQLKKSYQDRVAADVRDFRVLGDEIKKGALDGDAWVFFFTQQPRSRPDASGRTYAALADLIGHKNDEKPKGPLEGGCGYLLAATYAKPGKPPDNVPSVKAYAPLPTIFDPIRVAAKKGSPEAAARAYDAAAKGLAAYLELVEMPASLDDARYK